MNAIDLLETIDRKLQDPSYGPEIVLSSLNRGLLFIARQRPLPALQVDGEVQTVQDSDKVAMPPDFHAHLIFAHNKTKERHCRICYNRRTLRSLYEPELQKNGDALDVTDEGGFLYYRRVPVNPQTLKLTFYTHPELLEEAEESVPSCIPESLHQFLLVNYVLWDLFEEIEDGMEGRKVNTEYYAGQFSTGLQMLRETCPDPSVPKRYFSRRVQTF